jgi:hypothetical protein
MRRARRRRETNAAPLVLLALVVLGATSRRTPYGPSGGGGPAAPQNTRGPAPAGSTGPGVVVGQTRLGVAVAAPDPLALVPRRGKQPQSSLQALAGRRQQRRRATQFKAGVKLAQRAGSNVARRLMGNREVAHEVAHAVGAQVEAPAQPLRAFAALGVEHAAPQLKRLT